MDITDERILAMSNVPPQMAARYLSKGDDFIFDGLRDGTLPFGTAVRSSKSGKWVYDIRPEALVRYKHSGKMDTTAFANEVVQKILEALNYNRQEVI